MKNATVNLRNLVILVADPSSYWRRAIYGILRSFGANKVIEVEHSMDLIRILSSQKIDILLCDTQIHPHNWLKLTQMIRRNATNENRTVPILLMSGDTSETDREERARCRRQYGGREAAVAEYSLRPALLDRVQSASVCRLPRPISGRTGASRSKAIRAASDAAKATSHRRSPRKSGPALAQNDIDSLFKAAKTEQHDA